MNMMDRLAHCLGAACGLVMRVWDLLTGKRRGWSEETRP